jgi:transposase
MGLLHARRGAARPKPTSSLLVLNYRVEDVKSNGGNFTPTSASWINQVERWFAELTRKRLQRGVHTSVRKLEADIRAFIDRHNQNPRPFKWTKSADQILASVKRFCHKAQQTLCAEL